jgi:hypothetical protein
MAAAFVPVVSSYNFALPPLIGGPGGTATAGVFSLGTPYTTGGVAVLPALFGVGRTVLDGLLFNGISRNGLIHMVLNAAGTHVLAYNNGGVEIANGTDLSAAGFNSDCIALVR